MEKIGFIGVGKVGTAFGIRLAEKEESDQRLGIIISVFCRNRFSFEYILICVKKFLSVQKVQ